MDTKDIVIIMLVIAIILAVGGIFVLNSNSNDNSDDNVTEAVPAVQEATPNDASNDNEKQKIESIRKKVKALKVIKDTEREIRESTSGAKSLGLIIDKSNENPKIYNIAYGMNGEDKFETYGFIRYNTNTQIFEEKDPISGEYVVVN